MICLRRVLMVCDVAEQTQKLQMLAMSKPDVSPGSTETQQLRVMVQAPGVRPLPPLPLFLLPSSTDPLSVRNEQALVRLRLRIAYTLDGAAQQDQTDFSFPAELMA